MNGRRWSEAEIAMLRRAYETAGSGPVDLASLATALGRNKGNVCRKAGALGLADAHRAKKLEKVQRAVKYRIGSLEHRAHVGECTRRRIAEKGHPRGMAGKRHTAEALAAVSAGTRRAWSDPSSKLNSPEQRERRAREASRRWEAGLFGQGHSRARRGVRPDIGGMFFRSAWEANYARFLNHEKEAGRIRDWAFEPRLFRFSDAESYTPDFCVWMSDGTHEWHEVKGWLTDKGQKKLALMALHCPEEVVRVIDAAWFKQAERELGQRIHGWERAGSGRATCVAAP